MNAEEYLDIVDGEGEPTGRTKARSLVHRDGDLHRTSHVWIARRKGGRLQLLLQKRSRNKDSHPGCYDISSAGHIPAGSDFEDSALRELKEELGVDAEAGELECCGVRRIHWEDRFYGKPFLDNQVSRVYVLWKNLEISQFCPQTSEIEAVRWMDLETLFEQVERNSIPHCIFTEELCMVKRKLEEESAFPVLPAEEEDLEAILSLERIAFERLSGGQKDWYVTDDMRFLRRHLKAEGALLKIPCGRRLAAFLALRFPKDAADSLFPYAVQYAGAAKGDERLCAHMETVAVHPDFYGNGLMKKLLEEGISLAEREGMRYLLATVHPDNRFSRGNFEKAGFRPLTETRKYGGLRRLIYYYECSGS
ncbi:MAG TPA: GNAT family N-acetyltransferase [Candidatus Eisenbergiella pullicola]|nr:GNAT family N-acetyltransferase [Candidatus Eisenbergiella pullicola]